MFAAEYEEMRAFGGRRKGPNLQKVAFSVGAY